MFTYGGGPADRIEDYDGEQKAGIRLTVTSDITGREWSEPVITGPNGRVPTFHLPREWEWSQVSLTTGEGVRYPLPTPREIQGTAAVFHLRERVDELTAEVEALRGGGDEVREGHVAGAGVES